MLAVSKLILLSRDFIQFSNAIIFLFLAAFLHLL